MTGTPRRRVDPHGERAARAFVRARAAGAASCRAPRDIEGGWIAAVVDCPRGLPDRHGLAAYSVAARLADGLGAPLIVAALDAAPDAAPRFARADRLLPMAREAGAGPEAVAAWLRHFVRRDRPRAIVLPDRMPGLGDVARRVAVAERCGLVAGVASVAADAVQARTGGGAPRPIPLREVPPRAMLLVETSATAARDDAKGEGRVLAVEMIGAIPVPVAFADAAPLPLDAVPLREAEFVLGGGNGIACWSDFHALARALCAVPGGTRVVCDLGLLPKDRQIGSSGQIIQPGCYVALGIAGAPQHLQGIGDCPHVVAVNTDLHAAMIRRADLAIVADAQPVMEALLRRIGESQSIGGDHADAA